MQQHRDPLVEADDVADLDEVQRSFVPFVRVVDGVYGDDECTALIARIEALGPSFAPITTSRGFVDRPDIRNNDRVIFDDVDLAQDLFRRLRPHLPLQRWGEDPEARRGRPGIDPSWEAVALNERFRGYRYGPGQRFAPHYDGAFRRSDDELSAITVLLYLSDSRSARVGEMSPRSSAGADDLNEGCVGGDTRILDWGCTVVPRRGSVLLFDHHILHEGAEVMAGRKYALRSDVMYRRG